MDPNTWKQVESLFHEAIERPVDKQRQFVLRRAGENGQLAHEVLSLLSSHQSSDQFLKASNADLVASAIQSQSDEFARVSKRETALAERERPFADKGVQSDSGANGGESTHGSFPSTSRPLDLPSEAQQNISAWQDLITKQLSKDFEVADVISSGGMGTVFRATDRKLNRPVAIKVISASQEDEAATRRFVRESKIAAQVASDHVVTIYSVTDGQGGGSPTIVMELLNGQSVRDLIKQQGTLPARLAATIAQQTAKGLADAHQQQLIHRDIKPANLMLADNYQHSGTDFLSSLKVKIIDFGIARDLQSDEVTRLNAMAGTPSFMSPEQIFQPASIDHRCDIYAAGATLYQMLTGEPPYRGAPHTIIRKMESGAPIPPRQLDDQIPVDLENICLKALTHDPARRYSTATKLAEDLQRFLDGKPTLARPVSTWTKLKLWQRRNRGLATALSLLFASLLAGTIVSSVMWNRSSQNATLATNNAALAYERADNIEKTKEHLASSNQQMRQALDSFFLNLLADESQRAGLSAEFHFKILSQMTQYYSSVLDHSDNDPDLVLDVCDSVVQFTDSVIENGGQHKGRLGDVNAWVDTQLARLNLQTPTTRFLNVAAHNKMVTVETAKLIGEQGRTEEDFTALIQLARQSIAIAPTLKAKRILLLSESLLIEFRVANKILERPRAHSEIAELAHQMDELALQHPDQLQLQLDRARFQRWLEKTGGAEQAVSCRQKAKTILRTSWQSIDDGAYKDSGDDSKDRLDRRINVNEVWLGIAFARVGNLDTAFASIADGLQGLSILQSNHPSNNQYRMDIAEAELMTADLRWFCKDYKESFAAYDRSLGMFLTTLESDPSQMNALRRASQIRHIIAQRNIQLEQPEPVAALYKKALEGYRGIFARGQMYFGDEDVGYFHRLLSEAIQFYSTSDPTLADELKKEQSKFTEKFQPPSA